MTSYFVRTEIKRAEVKEQLAAKYDRLSRLTKSEPKRIAFTYRANRCRNQAEAIRIKLAQQN